MLQPGNEYDGRTITVLLSTAVFFTVSVVSQNRRYSPTLLTPTVPRPKLTTVSAWLPALGTAAFRNRLVSLSAIYLVATTWR